ncbi:predicted protein [Arabidopsis lyrata subsp. lyrata]|uniref:Predicted protein n=1 Tax=Arabidopsis lyrata subsp. lyrata TaxID=81972 RepID=D7KMR7_ARALL|nr:uncharacterized protein LOC9329984 [Arabidopsis lyrata subsp. lyrata]EFH67485.1 predicted protein [Arabidopsis lyrata subsp. lyrata]|eukprot:XP_020870491.1 uncharacterized protein LOC9329984 [Arabidopsis lyrata subsp. lyrata]
MMRIDGDGGRDVAEKKGSSSPQRRSIERKRYGSMTVRISYNEEDQSIPQLGKTKEKQRRKKMKEKGQIRVRVLCD